ncbi:hypothetical protein JQ615_38580 [Bradyrhizobium jicamae]|uniref:Uncharacterized protein n=1 Tax=Bradyrhizobium jicamae TaxID=280332 RepID=A0ABS5FWU9_9BRAD|nr:hypothetical protein [Bradyrhizobium jicamae]MBR0801272.1 hypothetical protein [Bradyrhizobium jicamae]
MSDVAIKGATSRERAQAFLSCEDIVSLFSEALFDAAVAQRARGKWICDSDARQFAVAQTFSSN